MTIIQSHIQVDEDDFKEEQNSVARLIQLLHSDDTEEMFKVLDFVLIALLMQSRLDSQVVPSASTGIFS